MPDESTDWTPEYAAYHLLKMVGEIEQRSLWGRPSGDQKAADREWLLDTYAECVRAVRGDRQSGG